MIRREKEDNGDENVTVVVDDKRNQGEETHEYMRYCSTPVKRYYTVPKRGP